MQMWVTRLDTIIDLKTNQQEVAKSGKTQAVMPHTDHNFVYFGAI